MNDWTSYFEFNNFTPSPSQVKVLRKTLDELLWISPSDSSLKIEVRKSKALFNVRCYIAATSGKFAAEGVSEDFLPALRIMESGIHREVNRWKQSRMFNFEEGTEQRVS